MHLESMLEHYVLRLREGEGGRYRAGLEKLLTDAATGEKSRYATADGADVTVNSWSDDFKYVVVVKSGPSQPPEYFLLMMLAFCTVSAVLGQSTLRGLTADGPAYYGKYWFGKFPWEAGAQAEYWRRSPLSLVGNVKTPTMLITGEQDYRTPISETEQYYAGLKLNGVDSAMVRVPESSHGMLDRPSRLVAKSTYILGWFAKHGGVAPEASENK